MDWIRVTVYPSTLATAIGLSMAVSSLISGCGDTAAGGLDPTPKAPQRFTVQGVGDSGHPYIYVVTDHTHSREYIVVRWAGGDSLAICPVEKPEYQKPMVEAIEE
jgi:hypothetical protein